jgi:3-oxoacyl-[acyl-carrier protein] reductase
MSKKSYKPLLDGRSNLGNREVFVRFLDGIFEHRWCSDLSVHGATKAALNGFTSSLAREIGKAGVTINSLATGFMQTDMTGELQGEKLDSIKRRSALGRLATVKDAAASVTWLLGDDAAAITGTTLTVDAGSTA